jgi:dipeptidyl aminopeptidase/acylaminoacyl peptidase
MAPSSLKSMTAEAIVDREVPNHVRISPSGRQVVYTLSPDSKKDKNAVSSIWIAKVGEKHSARQVTSGLFNDTSPRWSPDEHSIAFISDRAERGATSAIYLIATDGGEAYPISKPDYKKGISAFSWSPNGHFIAFLSPDEKSPEKKVKEDARDDAIVYGEHWEYNRLRYIHIATREISTLITRDAHVAEITWSQDSHEIAFTLHAFPEFNSMVRDGVKFGRVSLSTGEIDLICRYPGMTDGLVWRGNDLFFAGGVQESKTTTSKMVYKLSLDDRAWSKHAYGTTNDVAAIRLTGDSIWVQIQSGLSDQIHLLDSDKILYNEVHKIDTWDITFEEQHPVLTFSKSSLNCPIEIFSLKEGTLCQLSQHGAALAALEFGTAEPFYCKANDGTDLDGVFMTPQTTKDDAVEKASPWPTFVHVRGGPYWRVSISFDSVGYGWGPWLVSAGYAVLEPNYRGGSGHGDKFASAAIGGMGTDDYDDVISMVKAGISKGLIDEKKVVIGGWSQGGFLSYLAVTRSDFSFRAAICGAGVVDWDMMSMTSDVYTFESELAGKAPWEGGSDSTQDRRGSPLWHMKNVKTPILILHGENDVRVPVSQAVAFHRGCLHHKIPCEMVIYPREPHFMQERLHRLDMLKRIRRFCDLHLS